MVESPDNPDSMNSDQSTNALRVAFAKGKTAAWQNRWPGLCLWVFGIALILGYYQVPAINEALESLGEIKTRLGWRFSVVSTAVFGGLLPVVLPLVFRMKPPENLTFILWTNCLFWALKGLEIDWFYQLQAWLLGDNTSWSTVLIKVLIDQAIYAPWVGLLNCVLFYIWRDNGFRWKQTREALGDRWYIRKVLPALISNWCVWLPSVLIIYLLPLALQLPVQNLILCFWVLVLVFFTAEDEDHSLNQQSSESE